MSSDKKKKHFEEVVTSRISSIDSYITKTGFGSYDPYDGLSSPFSKFVAWNQLLSRIWLQSIRLLPFNIRPILCIRKMAHTKTISDFASAYAILYSHDGKLGYKERASESLRYLEEISLKTANGLGWGLRFAFATRFVYANEFQPNVFQTINAIHSFLDGYESLGDSRYLDLANKGFSFLKYDLGYSEEGDQIYWNYWENVNVQIYNISGLMIGLTARMWKIFNEPEYLTYCKKLFNSISRSQNGDGSWPYSSDPKGKFIDGFHTGYILEGLIRGIVYGAIEQDQILQKGVEYYLNNLFTEKGIPKYYNTKMFPVDGQNVAQSLQTLMWIDNVTFAENDRIRDCFEQVDRLLWNSDGYYNYKKDRFWTYKMPMHRWVTGPMFLSLVQIKCSN